MEIPKMSGHDEFTNFGWKTPEVESHHEYTIPAILNLLPKEESLNILDVGCGNGYLANHLSKIGHHVIGVDIAEDGIRIAKETYPHLKFELHSAYEKFDNLLRVPADVVIASEVIEHLYFPQRFLKNIHDALCPGGYLILTTPYHGYLKNLVISLFNKWDQHHHPEKEGGHIKFFSEKSLGQILIENGFVNITFRNAGRLPFFWKSMVCRARKVVLK
jgi:SAM-dependent methyltransferase